MSKSGYLYRSPSLCPVTQHTYHLLMTPKGLESINFCIQIVGTFKEKSYKFRTSSARARSHIRNLQLRVTCSSADIEIYFSEPLLTKEYKTKDYIIVQHMH
jgi:hypothetical protein